VEGYFGTTVTLRLLQRQTTPQVTLPPARDCVTAHVAFERGSKRQLDHPEQNAVSVWEPSHFGNSLHS